MVRSPNWNQTDVARAVPAASETEVDQLLASLQRLTGIGVWSYDVSSDELWWSDEAKRIHGFDASATPTVSDVVDQYAEADRDGVMGRLADAIEHGESFSIDVQYASERTTERSIRLACEPLVEDGRTVTLHGVVQDVTDTKRQEQRIEILRRTSQELRNASSKAEVAEILADAAKNVLGLVNTTVRLVDENRSMLQTIEATEECLERAGDRPNYSVSEDTPAARTYRTGEPVIHANHEHTEDDHSRGSLRSGLYVPIGSHGVLSAGDVVVNAFEEHDLEAASLLGQLGAEAITRIGWVKRSRAI
ncbi:putative diguanylate cyclase [Haloferax massiliensis]|uniref:Putative diguanylate cyclase n=1 Tax=Haloferax massiliensis TaxID=1476858 RepID=A0A0D6JUW6_9EURY|nr:GAF domain-containing protein [Haloferax sp. ATB1]MDS0241743.1 GAF domain-containing protein [Haloferax sp. S2CR25]MDS0444864.1 GAF domain-containing protein [Haloferax sp. S2CR25-2]CQR52622.1 putative diguanylate cyclase [Haloferax massiliensis]